MARKVIAPGGWQREEGGWFLRWKRDLSSGRGKKNFFFGRE